MIHRLNRTQQEAGKATQPRSSHCSALAGGKLQSLPEHWYVFDSWRKYEVALNQGYLYHTKHITLHSSSYQHSGRVHTSDLWQRGVLGENWSFICLLQILSWSKFGWSKFVFYLLIGVLQQAIIHHTCKVDARSYSSQLSAQVTDARGQKLAQISLLLRTKCGRVVLEP